MVIDNNSHDPLTQNYPSGSKLRLIFQKLGNENRLIKQIGREK